VDHSLRNVLQLLVQLRTILLQDAAVLYSKYPKCSIWSYAPFSSNEFRQYASSSIKVLEEAERNAKRQFEQLPEKIAVSFQGAVQTFDIKQALHQEEMRGQLEMILGLISSHGSSVESTPSSESGRTEKCSKKRKSRYSEDYQRKIPSFSQHIIY